MKTLASHELRSGTIAQRWRSGRPSTSRKGKVSDHVQTLAMESCHVTIKELVDEVGKSMASIHSILSEDLAIWRVFGKIDAINAYNETETAPSGSIAGHATPTSWILWSLVMHHGFAGTTEKPVCSCLCGDKTFFISAAKQKARQVQRKSEHLLDFCWVVHLEYAPQGQNIIKKYYLEEYFCDAVWRRITFAILCAIGSWQLHCDNTPVHFSHLMKTFFTKHNIPLVCQTTYSSNMDPCGIWLFPNSWKKPDFSYEKTLKRM